MKRENGTGSVYKLKGNRRRPWVAATPKGKGQPAEYIGYFKTEDEANVALMEYNKNPRLFNDVDLKTIHELWFEDHSKGIGQKTRETYEFAWKHCKDLENRPVNSITPYEIQDLINSKTMSRGALKKIKTILNQVFQHAVFLQVIDVNPVASVKIPRESIEVKKAKAAQKEIFTAEEIDLMWKNQDIESMEKALFLCYTGLRISEAINLEISKINLEGNYLIAGTKTDAGIDRLIALPDRLLPLIKKLMDANQVYLFEDFEGNKYKDWRFREEYYRALDRAGIGRLSPHKCRKTYTSILNKYVANKDYIKRLAGHSDYAFTSNMYTSAETSDLINAIKNI